MCGRRPTMRSTHAHRVIDAFEDGLAERRGVVTVDGRMIENLHVDNARRVLAVAEGNRRLRQLTKRSA